MAWLWQGEMIAHQAIGMAAPVKAPTHGLQGHQESMAIGIVFINGLASVAATRDMISRTGILNAKGSCHPGRVH